MYEYGIANGLKKDGNWHTITVDAPVNTYDDLINGKDVPPVPSFMIGGLYSLRARGSYEAKIEQNGTASFQNVRLRWLAGDVTDAHSYNEARETGSDVYRAALEGFFGYFVGDTLLGASFNTFIHFYDEIPASGVPAGHQWNY